MEKYLEHLGDAIKSIRIADHILYVTYPVVRDKRLLLSSIDRIYDSLLSIVNAILQYDYLWKRIKLYQDSHENFGVFISKSAPRYGISPQEINKILEFISLAENHKKSPMEFLRREKIVILSDNLHTRTLDEEILKQYLTLVKGIMSKVKIIIK